MDYDGDPDDLPQLYELLLPIKKAGAVSEASALDVNELGVDPKDSTVNLALGDELLAFALPVDLFLESQATHVFITRSGRTFLSEYAAQNEDPAVDQFREWERWLALNPEAAEVFEQIASTGDREFTVARPANGQVLLYGRRGDITVGQSVLLDDLVNQQLLEQPLLIRERGPKNYKVPADAARYSRWVAQQPTPIQQVQNETAAGRAERPESEATRELRAAFSILHDQPVKQLVHLGNHLRNALHEAMIAYTGIDTEKVDQFKSDVKELSDPASRHGLALVELIRHVQKVNQSLHHEHDQKRERRRPPSTSEIEQACFLTAVVCHELERFQHTPELDTP